MGIVFGIQVYSSFESESVAKTGMVPMPNLSKDEYLGGHAVMIVGYNDHMNCFIVRNSWGSSWGDHGYFYLPYSYVSNPNFSSDFHVVQHVEDTSSSSKVLKTNVENLNQLIHSSLV